MGQKWKMGQMPNKMENPHAAAEEETGRKEALKEKEKQKRKN